MNRKIKEEPIYQYTLLPIIVVNRIRAPVQGHKWIDDQGNPIDTRGCEQWGNREWYCPERLVIQGPCSSDISSGTCYLESVYDNRTVVLKWKPGCVCVVSLCGVLWNDRNKTMAPGRECRCNVTALETCG